MSSTDLGHTLRFVFKEPGQGHVLDCDVCKNGRPEYTIRYNPGLNCLEFRQADDEQLFAAVLLGRKVMVSVLDGTFQSLKIYLASFGYGHESASLRGIYEPTEPPNPYKSCYLRFWRGTAEKGLELIVKPTEWVVARWTRSNEDLVDELWLASAGNPPRFVDCLVSTAIFVYDLNLEECPQTFPSARIQYQLARWFPEESFSIDHSFMREFGMLYFHILCDVSASFDPTTVLAKGLPTPSEIMLRRMDTPVAIIPK